MSFKTQHIQVDGSMNITGDLYLAGVQVPTDITNDKVNKSGDIMTGGLQINTGDISIMDGDAYFNRHVHIGGYLQIDGSLIYTNIQSISVSTGFIQLNTGLTGSPPPTLQSGIVVNRGTSAPYIFAYDENAQTFRIGITQLETSTHYSDASTQAVATREDSPTTGGVGFWNPNAYRIDTSLGFIFKPSSGRLGIGTSNPSANLHIINSDLTNSAIRLGSGTSQGDLKYNNNEDTLDFINYSQWGGAAPNPAASIRWFTNNDAATPKMYLHRDGNLGIGTSAPRTNLDVRGGGVTTGDIVNVGGIELKDNNILLAYPVGGGNQTAVKLSTIDTDAYGGLQIKSVNQTASTTLPSTGGDHDILMTLLSTGNVGIGITPPTYKLHVKGTAVTYGTPTNTIVAENAPSGGTLSNGAYYGSLTFRGNGYDWGRISTIQTDPGSSWTNRMAFFGMNGAGGSLLERMCIQNDGAVGIGTTIPLSRFEMSAPGTGYWNGSNDWSSQSPPSSTVTISNTTNGGYDSVLLFRQTDSAAATKASAAIGMVGTGAWTSGNNASQVSDMYIASRNAIGGITERMRIKSNGNVGIANTGALDKLHVSPIAYDINQDGGIRLSDTANQWYTRFAIKSNSGGSPRASWDWGTTEIMTIGSGAYVGIGNIAPSHPLHLTKSRASDIVTLLQNTASNGYGAVIDGGSSNEYTLQLRTYNSAIRHTFFASGAYTAVGDVTATNFILGSDEKLKTNIVPLKNSPVDVEYKEFELKAKPGEKRYGVIAQELQKTNPELVRTDAEGTLNVAYIDLLIKEIASLKERVAILERKTE